MSKIIYNIELLYKCFFNILKTQPKKIFLPFSFIMLLHFLLHVIVFLILSKNPGSSDEVQYELQMYILLLFQILLFSSWIYMIWFNLEKFVQFLRMQPIHIETRYLILYLHYLFNPLFLLWFLEVVISVILLHTNVHGLPTMQLCNLIFLIINLVFLINSGMYFLKSFSKKRAFYIFVLILIVIISLNTSIIKIISYTIVEKILFCTEKYNTNFNIFILLFNLLSFLLLLRYFFYLIFKQSTVKNAASHKFKYSIFRSIPASIFYAKEIFVFIRTGIFREGFLLLLFYLLILIFYKNNKAFQIYYLIPISLCIYYPYMLYLERRGLLYYLLLPISFKKIIVIKDGIYFIFIILSTFIVKTIFYFTKNLPLVISLKDIIFICLIYLSTLILKNYFTLRYPIYFSTLSFIEIFKNNFKSIYSYISFIITIFSLLMLILIKIDITIDRIFIILILFIIYLIQLNQVSTHFYQQREEIYQTMS